MEQTQKSHVEELSRYEVGVTIWRKDLRLPRKKREFQPSVREERMLLCFTVAWGTITSNLENCHRCQTEGVGEPDSGVNTCAHRRHHTRAVSSTT